jgi:hypothetical protein
MQRATLSLSAILAFCVAVTACGPRTYNARVKEGEKQSDRAGAALDDADKALTAYEIERAEERLRDADNILKHPDIQTNPEAEFLTTRFKEIQARVEPAKVERVRVQLEKKVAQRREVISKSVTAFRKASLAVEQKPTDRGVVNEARAAAKKVDDDIAWERELQDKDADLKAYVASLKDDLATARHDLMIAEKRIEFLDGPLKEHDEAKALAEKAGREKGLEEKRARYQEAQGRYRQCHESAEKLISATAELAKNPVATAAGKPVTGASLAKSCEAELKQMDARIAATNKAIAAEAKKAAQLAAAAAKKAKKKSTKSNRASR